MKNVGSLFRGGRRSQQPANGNEQVRGRSSTPTRKPLSDNNDMKQEVDAGTPKRRKADVSPSSRKKASAMDDRDGRRSSVSSASSSSRSVDSNPDLTTRMIDQRLADDASSPSSPHHMQVSSRFLLASLIGCTVAAFLSGQFVATTFIARKFSPPSIEVGNVGDDNGLMRRTVEVEYKLKNGKDSGVGLLDGTCSSDHYGACGATLEDEDDEEDSSDDEEESSDDEEDNDEEKDARDLTESLQFNRPATGQMLLMDFENVIDPQVLAADDPASSIIDPILDILSKEPRGGWKARSYHCHSVSPSSCPSLGHYCSVILTSAAHLAIQTSPSTHSAKLSLYTSTKGGEGLIRLAEKLKELFVPTTGDVVVDMINDSKVWWKIDYRGFRKEIDLSFRDPIEEDLGNPLSRLVAHKWKVASAESIFQRIDILDVIEPEQTNIESYRCSLTDDGSYESLHPELFAPNRFIYLDGVSQSSSRGEEAYHEALVHPAFFTHPNPKRAAIIGGGEGATLREVLKHDTIDHVKMIDIDQVMVEVSDEYLPTWNDCSDIVDSHESCFEDERADVLYEDAMAWFVNRFSSASIGTENEHLYQSEAKFDVVISDALDPQDTVEFANILYSSDTFLKSLYDSLTDDGVLVMQLGLAAALEDPAEEFANNANRAIVTKMIAAVGFKSMHTYEESHCGFLEPWTYLIACKSYDCQERFYANSAEIDRKMHQRIRRSHSGKPLLKHFDGATFESYQRPRKAFETVHCRYTPQPPECALGTGYHKNRPYFTADDFEVRVSKSGSSTGVYTKVDIPAHSYIKTVGGSINIPPRATELVDAVAAAAPKANESLVLFLNNHGMKSTLKGEYDWYIETTGLTAYMRHGDSDMSNVGHLPFQSSSPRNPVLERRIGSYATGYTMSLRDIRKGEELTINHVQQ